VAYIHDRIRLIETVPDDFTDVVDSLREPLIRELIRVLATFDSIDGELVSNAANYARIEQLIEALDNYLFAPESEYLQALAKFISGIGESAALTNEFLNLKPNPLYQQILKQNQFNTIKLFDKVAVDAQLANNIRSQITAAISDNGKVAEVINGLRDYIGGSDVNAPALTRYVKTQALTAYGTADASYVVAVGKNEGIDKWLYSGGLVKDSRAFCVARAGKVYTTAEVLKWPEEEKQWQGMIVGTNASNIFAYRGGWNCRHILSPVT